MPVSSMQEESVLLIKRWYVPDKGITGTEEMWEEEEEWSVSLKIGESVRQRRLPAFRQILCDYKVRCVDRRSQPPIIREDLIFSLEILSYRCAVTLL